MRPPYQCLIPRRLSPCQRAALQTLAVAARLEAQGCQVLGAHAIDAHPWVRIDATGQPPGVRTIDGVTVERGVAG